MSVKVNMGGLKKLVKNAEEINGKHRVTMDKVINDGFVSSCTKYNSFDELLAASPFDVNSPEEFKAIPNKEWDIYISENTSFKTWEEMQIKAMELYLQSQIIKGL